jgi:hypothetical protein
VQHHQFRANFEVPEGSSDGFSFPVRQEFLL